MHRLLGKRHGRRSLRGRPRDEGVGMDPDGVPAISGGCGIEGPAEAVVTGRRFPGD